MYVVACYFSYLAISIALTIWVARTLQKSGRVFLIEAFHGNEELADSVNRLLVVGFYLINVGYIALALKTRDPLRTLREVIELEAPSSALCSSFSAGCTSSTSWCCPECAGTLPALSPPDASA